MQLHQPLPLQFNLRYQQAVLAGNAQLQAQLLGEFQLAAQREAAALIEAMVAGELAEGAGPQERGALRLQILDPTDDEELEWCRREIAAGRLLMAGQLGHKPDAATVVVMSTLATLVECWGFVVLVHSPLPLGPETLLPETDEAVAAVQQSLTRRLEALKPGLGVKSAKSGMRLHRVTPQTRVALSSDRVSFSRSLGQVATTAAGGRPTVAACSLTPAGYYVTDVGELLNAAGGGSVEALVGELEAGLQVPLSSGEWSALLHARGLRMRQLGALYTAARLPHLRQALLVEMVARTAKRLLANRLRVCLLQLRQFRAQVSLATEAGKEREGLWGRLMLGGDHDQAFWREELLPAMTAHFGIPAGPLQHHGARQLPVPALQLALEQQLGGACVRRLGGPMLPYAPDHLQLLAEGGLLPSPRGERERERMAACLLRLGEAQAAARLLPAGHPRHADCLLLQPGQEPGLIVKLVDEACGSQHAQPILVRDRVAELPLPQLLGPEQQKQLRQEALAMARRVLGRSHAYCQALLIRLALLLVRLGEGEAARERLDEALLQARGQTRVLLRWIRAEGQGCTPEGRADLAQALGEWETDEQAGEEEGSGSGSDWGVLRGLREHLKVKAGPLLEERLVERLAAMNMTLALPADLPLEGAIPTMAAVELVGLTQEGRALLGEAAGLLERLVENIRRHGEGEEGEGERLARLIRTIVQLHLWLAAPAQRIIIGDRWLSLNFTLEEWSGPVRELLVRLITGGSGSPTTSQWIAGVLAACTGGRAGDGDLRLALALVHLIR